MELNSGQWFGLNSNKNKKSLKSFVITKTPVVAVKIGNGILDEIVSEYAKSRHEKIDLSKYGLLNILDSSEHESLQNLFSTVTFRRNQVVVKENTEPKYIYLIKSGELELSTLLKSDKPVDDKIETKKLHNMSAYERRTEQRKILFRQLASTQNKITKTKHVVTVLGEKGTFQESTPVISKSSVLDEKNHSVLMKQICFKMINLEDAVAFRKTRFTVECKSFETALYRAKASDLLQFLSENPVLNKLFETHFQKSEKEINFKVDNLQKQASKWNSELFKRTFKVLIFVNL